MYIIGAFLRINKSIYKSISINFQMSVYMPFQDEIMEIAISNDVDFFPLFSS